MSRRIAFVAALSGLLSLQCKEPGPGDTESAGSSSTGPQVTTVNQTTTVDPTTDNITTASSSSGTTEPTTSGSSSGTTEPAVSSTTPETSSSSSTGFDPSECIPLACDGAVYACGDCMDNDDDGKYDTADPECVSPCDDREDAFATGLPGDNMDPCKQDCFFDGNSGGGAGDCAWNLKCDELSPGGDKCPYDPNFNNCPEEQPQECIETCQVPNGCDCFGCCSIAVDGMVYDVFLGDQDCSVASIESCQMCTKNEDCDDECNPDNCEICFGETEPPPGCDEATCEEGETACTVDDQGNSNCPEGYFCSTGCCILIVPG